ncbi:MAG TPA: tetratricopeptide repeat protein, partial [Candidatus Brocadiaceae bacterium]
MNIKKQFWILILLIIFPTACRSPYYAKVEKKPKRGYLDSITDKITGATTPAQHKTQGISYFKKGMTEEALEELKLASEGIKDDGELHHYLGKAYYENDKDDEAVTELLAAVTYYKTNQAAEKADVYNDLGLAYKKKDAFTESLSAFKESLDLNPSVAYTHYNLGLLYYEKDMQDECITSLKKANKLDPNSADTHFILGMAYYKKKAFDKAINEFKQTIELYPKDAEAHNYLGALYYEQGFLGKSITEHKASIQLDRNYPEAFNNLGIALYAKDDLREAANAFEKALELEPDFAEAHYNLGLIYSEEGNQED